MTYKYRYSNRKSRIAMLITLALLTLCAFAFWVHKFMMLAVSPIYPSWYTLKKPLDLSARSWMLSYSFPWFVLTVILLTEFCIAFAKTNRFDAADYNHKDTLLINQYAGRYTASRHKPYYMETTEKLPNGSFTKFIVSEHTANDKEIAHEFIIGNVSEKELYTIIASRKFKVMITSNPEHKSIQLTRYFATLTDAERYVDKFKTEYWRTALNEQ